MFPDRLSNTYPFRVNVMESFDIITLHASVSNAFAMQPVFELFVQDGGAKNMCGFSIKQLTAFIEETVQTLGSPGNIMHEREG
uniref:Uncharacterized protein n=1 Tax=Angiostrongylus cantonensis TaxID=6313 RepID=A0A0K0D3G4_ANGCA